ncbi:hypothetical protein ACFMPD_16615 [Sedimentitalea sp. HM32M-2]|uniref:hypothetical protein n=1 Tax=Sedimentitalea sp. HM32M-2 TaxID=3351566 RepID=UPI0036433FC1
MDRPDGLSEDELLAHVRGASTPEQAARIEAMAARDRALRAELALMATLKGALAQATEGPDARAFGWKRLEAEIGRTARPAASRAPIWRIAAAVLGVVVLGQGAYIALAPGEEPLYRTVTEDAEGAVLGVAFAPAATAGEIEALLREAGGRIVDGPFANGLYRVAFADETAREAGQRVLAASPLIALLAEE